MSMRKIDKKQMIKLVYYKLYNVCLDKQGVIAFYCKLTVIIYTKSDINFTECPIGTYGWNCKFRCSPGHYGQLCKSNCSCQPCNPVTGCDEGNIYSMLYLLFCLHVSMFVFTLSICPSVSLTACQTANHPLFWLNHTSFLRRLEFLSWNYS